VSNECELCKNGYSIKMSFLMIGLLAIASYKVITFFIISTIVRS